VEKSLNLNHFAFPVSPPGGIVRINVQAGILSIFLKWLQ
jgi:hypothetical protein